MTTRPNLQDIVAEAKRKGYFATEDFPKLRFSPQEFLQLAKLLEKEHIPFGKPEIKEESIAKLTEKEAHKIVDALRRGIPPIDGIDYYSEGRQLLLNQVSRDLTTVAQQKSLVRFLNADIGQGKTHTLYQLREFAFKRDFAVSIVTLSQNSCPLYDFMAVYHDVMWGLRTADQRQRPALSNIFDRWIEEIRKLNPGRVIRIVRNELPSDLRDIMASYADATNMFRPDEVKRELILKYLGGEKLYSRDLDALGIHFRLTSDNALQILSEMATTIRHIGFKGICILFDEAEAIHSFARSDHRDQAFRNLRQIINQSQTFPHCYFVYATTPSFFASYTNTQLHRQLSSDSVMELGSLMVEEMQRVGTKVAEIYAIASGWKVPAEVIQVIHRLADIMAEQRIGDYIRRAIAILDETRPNLE